VYEELKSRGIIPWIDRYHYPVAHDAFEALRENLLKCRHVAYFITPAMLRQGRGWCNAERAFAATIQQYLRYGGAEVAHVELPLLFMASDDPIFQRSLWRSLIDKARACPAPIRRTFWQRIYSGFDNGARNWGHAHIQWAADTIQHFVRQEREKWALDLADSFAQDTTMHATFAGEPNLMRRLLAQSPRPLSSP
jgi:hypothetical protein